ncbi:peptidoglycan-binding protein [Candidatus Parcubacteria bacterium]|nr:peptidoglycan-binding protein [Candidatus Parcubacteria bacterium]
MKTSIIVIEEGFFRKYVKVFYFGVFLFVFSASPVFGADWYVRSIAGEYGTEDGLSCATAWDGFPGIVWGTGGVVAGDVLNGCDDTFYETDIIGVAGITLEHMVVDGEGIRSYGLRNINMDGSVFHALTVKNHTTHNFQLYNSNNIIFDNYEASGTGTGIEFRADTGNVTNIRVTNSNFHDLAHHGLAFWLWGETNTAVFQNIEIDNNTFSDLSGAGRMAITEIHMSQLTRDNALINSRFGQGWNIHDNTSIRTTGPFCRIQRTVDGVPNYITDNTASYTGYGDVYDNNALQLHAINDFTISGNDLSYAGNGNVSGDGNLIIIDYWDLTNSDVISDGVEIFDNYLHDNNPANGWGLGISVFMGKNINVHNNVMDGCKSGTRVGNYIAGESYPGVVFSNNTTMNSIGDGHWDQGNTQTAYTFTNNIIVGSGGEGFDSDGPDPIESNNVFYNNTGGNYSGFTLDASDLEVDIRLDSQGRPTAESPVIDTGTDVSLTSDFDGNPICGVPDMGAYEYQPPYTVGTTAVPTTGSIRIYSDGKYRMKTASTTSETISASNFSVTPVSGSYGSATTQYMDLNIDTWSTTGNKNKQWTASSESGDFKTLAGNTIYTVGDLLANIYYQFKLDGAVSTAITGTNCNSSGACLTDSSGQVIFTYTGGYSSHIFALEKDTTSPRAFSLATVNNAKTSNPKPTLIWDASSDASSSLSKYQLYINNSLDTDDISSSATSTAVTNSLICGSHTWFVKAVDNNGNTTNSDTRTITMVCDGRILDETPITSGSAPSQPSDSTATQTTVTTTATSTQTTATQTNEATGEQNNTETSGQNTQNQITIKYTFAKPLYKTLENEEVAKLQQVLRELGIFTHPVNTNYFGTITEEAVKQFQCKYGIVCSGTSEETGYGLVGAKTRAKLNFLQTNTYNTPSVSVSDSATVQDPSSSYSLPTTNYPLINNLTYTQYFTGNLYLKLQNDKVKKLQEILAQDKELYPEGITSGYYGNLTLKAVQRFQCKYDIVCAGEPGDTGYGVFGPTTRAKFSQIYGGGGGSSSSVSASDSAAVQSSSVQGGSSSTQTITGEQSQQVAELQKQISDMLKIVEFLTKQLDLVGSE